MNNKVQTENNYSIIEWMTKLVSESIENIRSQEELIFSKAVFLRHVKTWGYLVRLQICFQAKQFSAGYKKFTNKILLVLI